jgi:hypothetical protein
MEIVERQLLTRPVTHELPDFGLHANPDMAADQLFQCWRLLLDEKSVGEIAGATGLSALLIAALCDRFW